MILGFIFQVTALHFGALALVEPILALELLFVFGYLAVAGRRRVKVRRRDWLGSRAMSAGIGIFLWMASPSGGRLHAPGPLWLMAGLVTFGVVLAALAVAFGLGDRPGASRSRRTAVLGAATGIAWGSWPRSSRNSARTLVTVSGPSSPPGRLTCSLPWWVRRRCSWPPTRWLPARLRRRSPGSPSSIRCLASLLGVFLFGEHIRTGVVELAGEALALAIIVAGAWTISHSCLILGEDGYAPCLPDRYQVPAQRKQLRELVGTRVAERAGQPPLP